MNYADTNWLEAVYITPHPDDREPQDRERIVLEADFDGRLFVDPMNWDLVRRECHALFSRYAWKIQLGTLDTAVVASAKLAGGTRFLSFDRQAKALAVVEGLDGFPPLDAPGKRIVSALKH